MKNRINKNFTGFSLVEILVAVGLLGLSTVFIAGLIGQSSKIRGTLNSQDTLNNLQREANITMQSQVDCTKTFSNEVFNVADIPLADLALTTPLPKTFSTPTPFAAPLTTLNLLSRGIVAIHQKINPTDSILDLNLIFRSPTTPGELSYIADLEVKLQRENSSGQTAQIMVFRSPLRVNLEVIVKANITPTPLPTQLKIKSCYNSGGVDVESLCIALGGRWLKSTNNIDNADMAVRCPLTSLIKPRCEFSNAYQLMVNELPDEVPCDGGTNKNTAPSTSTSGIVPTWQTSREGERAETCYYQKGNAVAAESCRTFVYGTGKQCVYDLVDRTWKLVKSNIKNISGVATPPWDPNTHPKGIVRQICDRGVRISRRPDYLLTLDWNQELWEASGAPTFNDYEGVAPTTPRFFSWKQNLEWLGTVQSCNLDYVNETWVDCANATDLSGAVAGEAGHCVYVENIKLANPKASKAAIQKCIDYVNSLAGSGISPIPDPKVICPPLPDNTLNYTGWVVVDPKYPRKVTSTKASRTQPEETTLGIPRFNNKYVTYEARGRPCFSVNLNTYLAVAVPQATPWFITPGQNNGTAIIPTDLQAQNPDMIFGCLVDNLDGDLSALAATSRRQSMLLCKNKATDISGLANSTTKVPPDPQPEAFFEMGSCWYLGMTALHPQAQVFKNFYDGWMFFTDNPHDRTSWDTTTGTDKNQVKTTSCRLDINGFCTYPKYPVSGIPCNGGVLVNPNPDDKL